MDSVVRGAAIYLFLLLVFRISGKRTLSQVTTFDFLLLLIISETVQEAMVNDDHSLTHAALLVITLVGIDIGLSLVKRYWKAAEKVLDDIPLVIVENGRLLEDRARKCRVDLGDVLHAARELQGLERLDQIKFAVLERNGGISIVPKSESAGD